MVLGLKLEDFEQQMVELGQIQEEGSPESEKRRNQGKLRRESRDNDNRAMCDWYSNEKHTNELSQAAKLSNVTHRDAVIQKEREWHNEYTAGQKSSSPVKHVESE